MALAVRLNPCPFCSVNLEGLSLSKRRQVVAEDPHSESNGCSPNKTKHGDERSVARSPREQLTGAAVSRGANVTF